MVQDCNVMQRLEVALLREGKKNLGKTGKKTRDCFNVALDMKSESLPLCVYLTT